MSLYPSLEDMKVDQMMVAQATYESRHAVPTSAPPYPISPSSVHVPSEKYVHLYPQLDDYMGLQLSQLDAFPSSPAPPSAPSTEKSGHLYPHLDGYRPSSQNAVVVPPPQVVAVPTAGRNQLVAPVSGGSLGLARAEVHHGIREILLCKDQKGKVGLRVQAINKGIFIVVVEKNTPAAMAGLRFGDQILVIDEVVVAGLSWEKVHKIIKKANPQRITMVVRDRPFERTVTVHKDSLGHVGFGFKNGKINNIVKDSSAARNGLLIDHHMLEVNGQNVVGLKDSEAREIIEKGGRVITLTIMPTFVFDHLLKNTASSYMKKTMDHSIPEI